MDEEGLLPISEVARRMGVHPNSVKRIPVNDLSFYRIGMRGDRRYRWDDVKKYLERKRVGS